MSIRYFELREERTDANGQTVVFQEIDQNGYIGEPLREVFPEPWPNLAICGIVGFQEACNCKVLKAVQLLDRAYFTVDTSPMEKSGRFDAILNRQVFTVN